MKLNNEELNNIDGGVSGTLVTNAVRGIQLIFDLGKSLGSAIRRYYSRNFC